MKFKDSDFGGKRLIEDHDFSFFGINSEAPIFTVFIQFIEGILKSSGGLRKNY